MEDKEIIIGRNGNQPFPITAEGVSAHHASLTICSDGKWILRDLSSTNGTFIRNSKLEFERIVSKVITKDTVVRLGGDQTIRSIQFTAALLTKTNPMDFSYEFEELKDKWDLIMTKKRGIEKRISILSYLPPIASLAMLGITLPCKDINTIRGVMVIPGLLSPFISSFSRNKLRNLNEEIKNTFICPNPRCNLPLTETEIKKGMCLKCKSHI